MAAYKNYTSTFYSNRNNRYDIEIWSKADASTGNTFNVSKGGFKLSYKGSDNRNNITMPSELTFNFMVENGTQETYLTTLLSSDDTEYFLVVRRNFVIFWWGGLKAGFDSFDNDYYPFVVTLKATDYIGDFINEKEDTALPDDVLAYAGEVIGTNLHDNSKISEGGSDSFLESCFPLGASQLLNRFNNRWVGEDQYFADSINPFSKQRINYNNFLGSNSSTYSKSDAYKGYLKSLSMCAFQADGFYNVIQPFSYTTDTFRVTRKPIGEESYVINVLTQGQTIDNRQNAENDSSVAPTVDSGFKGDEWLLNPADLTDGWDTSGSVTMITANSFNIALTTSYMYYDLVEGEYCVSYSENDTSVKIVYANTSGADNDLLTESGQANFSIGATGGRLKIMATSTGTKTIEFVGLQKGTFQHRRFIEGQDWRYQRPYGRVSASYNFGNSFAVLSANNTSTTSSIYTTLTNIGAVSDAQLTGAVFNTGFKYAERFDTLSQGIESINGRIHCKLKIGTQYLTGTIGTLAWTTVDSTFYLTVPTWASFTNSDGEYSWYYNNGPTLVSPQWYDDTGSIADIQFGLDISLPSIPASGAISFQFVSGTINYYTFDFDIFSGTAPTPSTITQNNLETRWSVSNSGISFADIGEQSTGIDYTATTPNLNNFDSFDMGSMPIGNTSNEDGFESALTVVNITGDSIIPTYVQVNATGDQYQMTSLASQEYISPQTSPLKMIEGNYYVNDFSAFKAIVLDGEKYIFSEGTLTADTDTISGTWYKLSTTTETITVIDETIYEEEEDTPFPPNPHDPIDHWWDLIPTLTNATTKPRGIRDYNSVGLASGSLSAGSSHTKVDIINTARGKLYDNQKMLLTAPDGSYPMILVKDGDSTTSDTQINVDSFTPLVNYPVGSVLSMLVYDLTNVITGGGGGTPAGSDKEVQFNDGGAFGAESAFEYDKATNFLTVGSVEGKHYGTNIGGGVESVGGYLYVYLKPSDFMLTSNASAHVYTRGSGGIANVSAYDSRSNDWFGLKQLPDGYAITEVELEMSVGRSFSFKRSGFASSTVSTIETGGTSGTALVLSSAEVVDAKNTYIIAIEYGAVNDEVFGARIKLQKV